MKQENMFIYEKIKWQVKPLKVSDLMILEKIQKDNKKSEYSEIAQSIQFILLSLKNNNKWWNLWRKVTLKKIMNLPQIEFQRLSVICAHVNGNDIEKVEDKKKVI